MELATRDCGINGPACRCRKDQIKKRNNVYILCGIIFYLPLFILSGDSLMLENKRDSLSLIYKPLDERMHELVVKLTDAFVGLKISAGYYNAHYHKDDGGEYQRDVYPIPVIGVPGLCDIELDIDNICVTSKLTKDQIVIFDWSTFENESFEVYGVENLLNDYGDHHSANAMKDLVLSSSESEFFISFSFPISANDEQVVNFLRLLHKNRFYY